MVNKSKWGVHFLAPPLLFLLLCFHNNAQAQKINKYFTSLSQPNGVLYHVFSFASYNSSNSNSSFDFDVTYLSLSDSVVLNYTVLSSTPLQIKDITFGNTVGMIDIESKRLYIDNFKGKWRSRYSSTISKDYFIKLINADTSIDLIVESENSEQIFLLKGKVWDKHKLILKQIFQTILLNE